MRRERSAVPHATKMPRKTRSEKEPLASEVEGDLLESIFKRVARYQGTNLSQLN